MTTSEFLERLLAAVDRFLEDNKKRLLIDHQCNELRAREIKQREREFEAATRAYERHMEEHDDKHEKGFE